MGRSGRQIKAYRAPFPCTAPSPATNKRPVIAFSGGGSAASPVLPKQLLVTSIIVIGVPGTIAAPQGAFNERGYVDEVACTLRDVQKIAIASECDASATIDAASYVACNRWPATREH